MNFFLDSIQLSINLLFLIVVLGTIGISWIFSDRLRKRHSADFPWNKAITIIVIEVLIWIAFNFFFEIFQKHWVLISIGGIIVIFIILSRKKRKYV
jgi:hypothetical protein